MQKQQKTSLVAPILIMLAPVIALIASIILYAVINFVFTTVTPADTTTGMTSIADGASVSAGAENSTPIAKTILNVILFLLGAGSILGFIPCIVIGIIMINKRRNAQHSSLPTTAQRNWSDLE